jgi:ferrochelatase
MTSNKNPNSATQKSKRIGVLVTNLGTPDEPTTKALRRYLKEFLWDPRVVQIPRVIWWVILNLFILPFRPKKSAELYASVWTEEGSPLRVNTKNIALGISEELKKQWGDKVILDFAMRYGSDSIDEKINSMLAQGVDRLLVIPLYPQYSETTTASTMDAIKKSFKSITEKPELRFLDDYHDFPDYIDACATQIKQGCDTAGFSGKLLFSYHGLPQSFVDKGDPYYDQCLNSSALIAKKMGLEENELIVTFQSRFGKAEWLKPYTETTLKALPEQGIKSIHVFCPGFSADCLETLEEIESENKQYFIESGGEDFQYIPALNAAPVHIQALTKLINENLKGWE